MAPYEGNKKVLGKSVPYYMVKLDKFAVFRGLLAQSFIICFRVALFGSVKKHQTTLYILFLSVLLPSCYVFNMFTLLVNSLESQRPRGKSCLVACLFLSIILCKVENIICIFFPSVRKPLGNKWNLQYNKTYMKQAVI